MLLLPLVRLRHHMARAKHIEQLGDALQHAAKVMHSRQVYVCTSMYLYAFLVQFFVWEMVKVVAVARLPFGGNWQCRHSPSYSQSQSYIRSKSLAKSTRSARRVLNLVSATSTAAASTAAAREFSLPSDLLAELIICLACLQFPLRSFHYALTTDCQVYYCFRFAYELPKARRLLHGCPEHPVPLLLATIYQPCAACSVQRATCCRTTLQPKTSLDSSYEWFSAAIHLFSMTAAVLDVSWKLLYQNDMIIMRKNGALGYLLRS